MEAVAPKTMTLMDVKTTKNGTRVEVMDSVF